MRALEAVMDPGADCATPPARSARLRFARRSATSPGVLSLLQAMVFLVLVALAVVWLRSGEPPDFSGVPRITDGDSLIIDDTRIRLKGYDAPEMRQTCRLDRKELPCGRDAREHLVAIVGGRSVACQTAGRDKYRRVLATCQVGRTDLGARMVEDGYAVAYGAYADLEADAKAAERGLWRTEFDPPERWRAKHGDMDLQPGFWEWLWSFA